MSSSTVSYPALAAGAGSLSQVELSAIIIVAIILLVIVRQFQARRVRPLSFILIALVVAVGFQPPGPAEPTPKSVGILLVGLVISAIFGIWRGATITIWRDHGGSVWTKGNQKTLWLWIATIVVRLLVAGVADAAFHQPFNVGAIWLGFAVTLAAQLLVVLARGNSAGRSLVPRRT